MRLINLLSFESQLAQACSPDAEISLLTAHTKDVIPGSLYVCAEESDKATGYIQEAIKAGAIAVVAYPHVKPLPGVIWFSHPKPRWVLTQLVHKVLPGQPPIVAAVTGTKGKSSIVAFMQQIWAYAKYTSASMGSVGIQPPPLQSAIGPRLVELLTPFTAQPLQPADCLAAVERATPPPHYIHACLAALQEVGVQCLAIEASSHGIDQERLAAVNITTAGFTNLLPDHLDYHPTMEDYYEAKVRLFTELLPPGQQAVINLDDPTGEKLAQRCKALGIPVWGYSLRRREADIYARVSGQAVTIMMQGQTHIIAFPLFGEFQLSNALCALGMAVASGVAVETAVQALAHLQGAPGRLEYIGETKAGGRVFVDYAHTGDALEMILQTARQFTKNKLWVVFGAGGNRDPRRRTGMGKAAAQHADKIIVTDDNPRDEDPATIRATILACCPQAEETPDRARAIETTMQKLEEGDILIVAGKGHETGQIIKGVVYPFCDRTLVKELLQKELENVVGI